MKLFFLTPQISYNGTSKLEYIDELEYPDFDNELFSEIKTVPRYKIHFRNKLTNFMKIQNNEVSGMVVSSQVKNILEKFRLPLHHYYPIEIKLHSGEINRDYYFLKLQQIDIQDFIIYPESIFKLRYFKDEEDKVLSIKDISDYNAQLEYYKKINKTSYISKIHLILNKPIEYDFFNIKPSIYTYISLALLEALKQNQILDFVTFQANFHPIEDAFYNSYPTLYVKDSSFKLEDVEIHNHIPKKDLRPKYTEPILPDFEEYIGEKTNYKIEWDDGEPLPDMLAPISGSEDFYQVHYAKVDAINESDIQDCVHQIISKGLAYAQTSIRADTKCFLIYWDYTHNTMTVVYTDEVWTEDSFHVIKCSFVKIDEEICLSFDESEDKWCELVEKYGNIMIDTINKTLSFGNIRSAFQNLRKLGIKAFYTLDPERDDTDELEMKFD